MKLNENSRELLKQDALKMAKTFNEFFQQPNTIAVTGGAMDTDTPEQYRNQAISPIDSCAVEGKCNLNRHPNLDEINIPNYKIIYGTPGEYVANIASGKNIFLSSGTIANPLSRLLYTQVRPEDLDTITVGDMICNRTYPATFALEPQKEINTNTNLTSSVDPYSIGAEAYRLEPTRPNWIVDLELNDGACVIIPSNKTEPGFVQLSDVQVEKYMTKQLVPVASGENWIVDYGIIGMHTNPFDENKDVLSNQGAHWLSGLGGNTLMTYTKNIPEETTITGNTETLATIYRILKENDITNYQAIINTTRMPIDGIDNMNNSLIAVIGLDN
ncbi:hypothetical protein GQ473_07100 [archaeon]|nr:hypothetical protein [archaeon]